ncbi:MAG: acyl-[acyl-carrier-protein] thioesterase [Ardenticatenaceae bacterium]
MAAPRTSLPLHVRSYEVRPDRRAGNVAFLNWFEEAAFANSVELGFDIDRFAELGYFWIMRESDLEIIERPYFNERILVTTWIADLRRVKAYHQYEAHRADGTLLARCNTLWILLDLNTMRPQRIPNIMHIFKPAKDFVIEKMKWPTVEGTSFVSTRQVAFFEEDQLQHVNNAVYLNWIEENARNASQQAGYTMPTFGRHWIQYRIPARRDDMLTLKCTYAPYKDGLVWYHEIVRDDQVLVKVHSLSSHFAEE